MLQQEQDIERLKIVLHELSNLLTGILVNAGLLKALHQDSRSQRYAQQVCEGAERAAALVREEKERLTPPENRLTAGPTEYAND